MFKISFFIDVSFTFENESYVSSTVSAHLPLSCKILLGFTAMSGPLSARMTPPCIHFEPVCSLANGNEQTLLEVPFVAVTAAATIWVYGQKAIVILG